jgi:hypothetical protein
VLLIPIFSHLRDRILEQPQTADHEHVHDHVNVQVDVDVIVDVAGFPRAKQASPGPKARP